MDMDFTIESAKTFDATVDAVVAETEAAGFRVLYVHDVSATLAEKGFERERVSIVEVCNAKYASAVLAADAKIGLLLPCPIMVYAEAGRIRVSTMRPTLIAEFFPDSDLGSVPSDVEAVLVGVMTRAAA